MTNSKTTKRALVLSLLSLLLCCSMLVGTTFAWFTDSVTSGNNTIVAGNLDIELYNDVKINDSKKVGKNTALFEEVAKWEPGVVAYENLTVANVGTLALDYKLSINFTNANLVTDNKLGLADVLQVSLVEGGVSGTREEVMAAGTAAGWSTMADFDTLGTLLPDEDDVFALVICWVPGENDNQWNVNNGRTTTDGKPLHIDLGINLLATQETYEEDSFNNQYDKNAGGPNANVTVGQPKTIMATHGMGGTAEEMEMDCYFIFETTETAEEGAASPYAKWHADFVVTVDKEVAPEAIALVGYYEAYCKDYNDDNWVAMLSSETISAGTEIRLVQALLDGGSVNYGELCEWIPKFECGALEYTDGTVTPGTTLNVELRLYEVEEPSAENGNSWNVETGNYITAGQYTYTFE